MQKFYVSENIRSDYTPIYERVDMTVKAEYLKVSYGKRPVLQINELNIKKNAGVIGLFGPNGAGKSTLMRTIVGDIEKYQGSLIKPDRSEIAYLPDKPFLYPWMSVEQCAELFESRHEDFRKDVFDRFLQGSDITTSTKVKELSKGMSERLHLALILSRSPKLYMLDEPLSGVDPLTRDHLLDLVNTLRVPDAPVLLSTHLISGVEKIFDEVILISDGRILAHDTADNLRRIGDGDLEVAYKRSFA